MDDILTCGRRHGSVVADRYRLGQVLRSRPDRCEHTAHDDLLHRTVTAVLAAPATTEPLPRQLPLPASARLEHGPGLAEVFDGGGEGGLLYLVVPRLDGTCLADDLADGPLPVPEVRDLGAGIARALWPIHRYGCAHGALGAELVTRGPGGLTVAGLGVEEWLARWARHQCDPPYPAPEQRAPGPSVSPATDVYALGRLLGRTAGRLPRSEPLRSVLDAMTARDPAARPTTGEVIDLLTEDAAPPPRRRSGRVPAGTVAALAAVGALTLSGLVAHTAGSTGMLGGATLGVIPAPTVVAPLLVGPVLPGPVAPEVGSSGPSLVAATPTADPAGPTHSGGPTHSAGPTHSGGPTSSAGPTRSADRSHSAPAPTSARTPQPSPTHVASPTPTHVARPVAAPIARPSAAPVAKPSATPDARPSTTPVTRPAANSIAWPSATHVARPSVTPVAKAVATHVARPSTTPTAARATGAPGTTRPRPDRPIDKPVAHPPGTSTPPAPPSTRKRTGTKREPLVVVSLPTAAGS